MEQDTELGQCVLYKLIDIHALTRNVRYIIINSRMPSDHRVGYSYHELLKITTAIQSYQDVSITAVVCFDV